MSEFPGEKDWHVWGCLDRVSEEEQRRFPWQGRCVKVPANS